ISTTTIFSFYSSGAHRDLHSFPTRRSSDLWPKTGTGNNLSRHSLLQLATALQRPVLAQLRGRPIHLRETHPASNQQQATVANGEPHRPSQVAQLTHKLESATDNQFAVPGALRLLA